ncbi:hypothetical protein QTP86_020079 [Hemibagrus guttatus]|nr:hypothetical protein QTP86_020079 [Hemibagrus guttatus]
MATKKDSRDNYSFDTEGMVNHFCGLTNDQNTALSEKDSRDKLAYCVTDIPPWYLCVILGIQHFLTAFGGIIAIPLILSQSLCLQHDGLTQSHLISTIFFVSGICTLLQVTLGVRAPVEIGLLLVKEVEEGGECTDRERRGKVGCELEKKERFWSELDEVMECIPIGERVVIGADFNGHVGEGNRGDAEVMGKFGVKERNLEGQMVVNFAKRMDIAVVNTYFQKREEHRVTYKSGGRSTQVDYILCRRDNLKEISDCKVVVGESVARQHRMVVCRMTLMVCKKKRSKMEKKTKWWKLKKEECCEEFRQKLRKALGGQVVLPDDWEATAEVIRETGRKVLGVSSGRRKEDKETWWWNEEVQDNLEKAYDRVPREELWYCMRKSGVAEKYVRVVQDMYERSRTVVRCAVGQTEEFKVEVGLHQGSALSPFLFAIVMDQLSEEVRQESPWTMMFADDIVICSESREQVEENLERWRLQGEEVKKVQEFKYLGSTVQSNGECGKEVKKRVQAETVSLRKRQESELEVAELKMLRLPILQGGTFTLLAPTTSLLSMPDWVCPAWTQNATLVNTSSPEFIDVWQSRIRVIQGSIMVGSLFQVLVGFSGIIGLFLRFIGPLTIAPTISLIGLSLFDSTGMNAGSHWGISAMTTCLIVLFSQYLRHIAIPLPAYSKAKKFHISKTNIFQILPVLLGITVSWLICYLLTIYNVLPSDPMQYGYLARTDIKGDVMGTAPWFRFPYPGQWGLPTVSLAGVLGILAGVISSMIESVGDYHACARLSGAPPPPKHAINRGIGIEGLGCLLAGAWGTGNGTTSYSENVGALGITKVGSRMVIVASGVIMIIMGLFGKIGAIFSTIPTPVIGGMFLVMFGVIAAVGISNLQYADMNSSRNIFIFGFSMFTGLVIPNWIIKNPDVLNTGIVELDQVLQVLLTTGMFVGGLFGFVLDNTIPGTKQERGMILWNKAHEDESENTVESEEVYGLPCGISSRLAFYSWVRYIPFCPSYKTRPQNDTSSKKEPCKDNTHVIVAVAL